MRSSPRSARFTPAWASASVVSAEPVAAGGSPSANGPATSVRVGAVPSIIAVLKRRKAASTLATCEVTAPALFPVA